MSVSRQIHISHDVVHEKVGDETVLLHLGTGVYFGLDVVGSRIWDILVESGDSEIAFRAIEEEYDVPSEISRRDVERLIDTLSEKKLICFEVGTAS
jgi:hypothetical protein